jgi:hypothetical protein
MLNTFQTASMIVFMNTANDFFEELTIIMLIRPCFLFYNSTDAQ